MAENVYPTPDKRMRQWGHPCAYGVCDVNPQRPNRQDRHTDIRDLPFFLCCSPRSRNTRRVCRRPVFGLPAILWTSRMSRLGHLDAIDTAPHRRIVFRQ